LGSRVEYPETEDADLPTQKWTPVWVKQRFAHIPQVNGDRFPSPLPVVKMVNGSCQSLA